MSIDLQKYFTKRFSSGVTVQQLKVLTVEDENNSKYLIFNLDFGMEAYEYLDFDNFRLVIVYKEKEFLKLELIEGDWLDELELVNTVPHLINSKIKKGKFVYSSVFEYVETIYTYSHKSIYTIVENNCPFSFKNFKTHTYLQPKKFGLAVFRHRINIQDIMEYSLFPEEVFLISSFDCSAHDLDTIWKTTNN